MGDLLEISVFGGLSIRRGGELVTGLASHSQFAHGENWFTVRQELSPANSAAIGAFSTDQRSCPPVPGARD